jgi:hypothetical protein
VDGDVGNVVESKNAEFELVENNSASETDAVFFFY